VDATLPPGHDWEANARLMAAAPRLLKELRRAEVEMHEDMANARFSAAEIDEQLEDIRAAIAQAEGA
jgi:hypothetical protein